MRNTFPSLYRYCNFPEYCFRSGLYSTYDPSIIQAQQVQKIRVNRVAIVQALRIEHVIPRLRDRYILSKEDLELIDRGSTQQEKTRLLLDLLPSKGLRRYCLKISLSHRRLYLVLGRNADWYGVFRDSLRNPDTEHAETRQKYRILGEFLDNTLVTKPPKKHIVPLSIFDDRVVTVSYPRYAPLPSISHQTSPNRMSREAMTGDSGLENSMYSTYENTTCIRVYF